MLLGDQRKYKRISSLQVLTFLVLLLCLPPPPQFAARNKKPKSQKLKQKTKHEKPPQKKHWEKTQKKRGAKNSSRKKSTHSIPYLLIPQGSWQGETKLRKIWDALTNAGRAQRSSIQTEYRFFFPPSCLFLFCFGDRRRTKSTKHSTRTRARARGAAFATTRIINSYTWNNTIGIVINQVFYFVSSVLSCMCRTKKQHTRTRTHAQQASSTRTASGRLTNDNSIFPSLPCAR